MSFIIMNNEQILTEMGKRLRRMRLNMNVSQSSLAETAGTSITSVKRLESGKNSTLDALVKVLRALNCINQIDAFLPDPGISPIQVALMSGRERKKASGPRLKGE